MANVVILPELVRQIQKTFKKESEKIYKLMEELDLYPQKGKALGHVGNVVIKELRYEKFRFYFLTDSKTIKLCTPEELKNLLIKFVRMSDKREQQKTIKEIKRILAIVGFDDFR